MTRYCIHAKFLRISYKSKRQEKKSTNSLEDYCANNPDALECRIYED